MARRQTGHREADDVHLGGPLRIVARVRRVDGLDELRTALVEGRAEEEADLDEPLVARVLSKAPRHPPRTEVRIEVAARDDHGPRQLDGSALHRLKLALRVRH